MPDYGSAHNNLGTALERVGRTNDALAHFVQAVKLSPNYWEAHFNVASGYLQSRRFSEARDAELETVVRLRPEFRPAQEALAQMPTNGAAR
jgi:Flp pilus assembly protein TadD